MQNLNVSKTADAWGKLANRIYVPHSEEEYRQLDDLLDCGLVDFWSGGTIQPDRIKRSK